jgi:hypothetical protein
MARLNTRSFPLLWQLISWARSVFRFTECSGQESSSAFKYKSRENISLFCSHLGNRGSSVSIVSDYGLDDRAIGVRSPAGAKDFSSSLSVQTGSGAHPASSPMGTGVPFPGCKARPGRDADHSPHLVPRSWMSRSYTSSLPKRLHGV